MFAIDLTPDDLKISQVRHTRVRLWIAVLAALVLAVLFTAAMYLVQWKKEKTNLQSLQQELQSVQNQITLLSQTQNQLDLWRDRIAVLAQLGLYPDYTQILHSLQKITPETLYVARLELVHPEKSGSDTSSQTASVTAALPKSAQMFLLKNPPAEPAGQSQTDPALRSTQMTLLGKALDHETVAAYLHALQSSPWCSRARLMYSRRQLVNQDAMIDFEIQCLLAPAASTQENTL